MNFLPTEDITYKTSLKEEEVLARLADNIEPEKLFRVAVFLNGSDHPYEGEIIGQNFSIRRIIGYRNSFLPRITGVVEKDYNGTIIKVKMRLHLLPLVAVGILTAILGFISLLALAQAMQRSALESQKIIPLGLLIFIYLITMGGFKYESSQSKGDLQEMFEAEIIEA